MLPPYFTPVLDVQPATAAAATATGLLNPFCHVAALARAGAAPLLPFPVLHRLPPGHGGGVAPLQGRRVDALLRHRRRGARVRVGAAAGGALPPKGQGDQEDAGGHSHGKVSRFRF